MCFLPVGLKTPPHISHLEGIHLSSTVRLTVLTDRVWQLALKVFNVQTLEVFFYPLTHLRVRYLRGFLGQTAALRRNQVVVLGADVLVGIVQTSWAGSRRRAEQMEGESRVTVSKS